jgi:hypothetical protein
MRLSILDTSLCAWPTCQPVAIHDGDMSISDPKREHRGPLFSSTLGLILTFAAVRILQLYQGTVFAADRSTAVSADMWPKSLQAWVTGRLAQGILDHPPL